MCFPLKTDNQAKSPSPICPDAISYHRPATIGKNLIKQIREQEDSQREKVRHCTNRLYF